MVDHIFKIDVPYNIGEYLRTVLPSLVILLLHSMPPEHTRSSVDTDINEKKVTLGLACTSLMLLWLATKIIISFSHVEIPKSYNPYLF